MSLPTPRAAANIFAQGISNINALSKNVMHAFTNSQVNAIRTLAASAPTLPAFSTGQRAVSVQFPRVERVFSAVPEALAKAMPSTGFSKYTKDTMGLSEQPLRARGRTAIF